MQNGRRLNYYEKKTIKTYREIILDNNGQGFDRSYRNPLTKAYQYEYALFVTMAGLFSSIRCQSMCIESLKLYFAELPHKNENNESGDARTENTNRGKSKSQEAVLEHVEQLVNRDVIGHITFPQMNICAAEVVTVPEKDGTHSFVFTDGIYGFRLHILVSSRKGRSVRIEVEDYTTAKLIEVEGKSANKSAGDKINSVVA